jgi:hypothetical protein
VAQRIVLAIVAVLPIRASILLVFYRSLERIMASRRFGMEVLGMRISSRFTESTKY